MRAAKRELQIESRIALTESGSLSLVKSVLHGTLVSNATSGARIMKEATEAKRRNLKSLRDFKAVLFHYLH